MTTCIYCRQRTDAVGKSQEHVVPQAMGGKGWLTTQRVCPACNNRLGDSIDSVAGSDVVRLLRAEAGITDVRPLRAIVIDDETGIELHGRLDPAKQRFDPDERTYIKGRERLLISNTNERARMEADRQTARGARRGETIKWGDLGRTAPDPSPIRVGPAKFEPVGDLLKREAAKIALGYVDVVGDPLAVMHHGLDGLRNLVVSGVDTEVGEGYLVDLSAGGVYLPRINFPLLVGPPGSEPPSHKDLVAKLVGSDADPSSFSAGLPRLDHVYHQMVFRRGESRLELTLFGLLYYEIPLPADLQVPWNRYDYRTFTGSRPRIVSGYSH